MLFSISLIQLRVTDLIQNTNPIANYRMAKRLPEDGRHLGLLLAGRGR